MADKHQNETQEQSIKARKHQLFESEGPARAAGRPFKEFLRETSAEPLSAGVKAALWASGVAVVALLVAALIKGFHGQSRPSAATPPAKAAPATVPPTKGAPVGKPA